MFFGRSVCLSVSLSLSLSLDFPIREQIEAASALMELRVWYEQPLPGGMPGWLLNPVFRKNLLTALLGGYVFKLPS